MLHTHMAYADIRNRAWEIIEPSKGNDLASTVCDWTIFTLIVLNGLALILETVEWFHTQYSHFFRIFEFISVMAFTVEYLVRIWSCVSSPQNPRPVLGRVRYATRLLPFLDLLAILPFWLPMVGVDLRSLRFFRLLRLARFAKLGRYSSALQTMFRVVSSRKYELRMTVALIFVLMVMASTLIYYAERNAQPEVFSSIPAAMWWAVITLTTIGYGDVYPVTPIGKLIGAVLAVLGVGLVALPTGILGAGFVDEIQRSRKSMTNCPHCGEPLP